MLRNLIDLKKWHVRFRFLNIDLQDPDPPINGPYPKPWKICTYETFIILKDMDIVSKPTSIADLDQAK